MSYNGTVYCRHCYQKGHNRRTCPQLTEQYKQRAEDEVKHGEERGYWHIQYAKRAKHWLDGTPATELKKSRREGARRCTYCAKTGHNRRTCPELAEHKAAAVAETRAIRERVVQGLREQGLGIGALVTVEQWSEKVGYMVTGFVWENITAAKMPHNPNVVKITALNKEKVSRWDQEKCVALPPIDGVNENSWNQVELVAPVSGSQVEAIVPMGFTNNQDWIKEQFKEARSPNWYDNKYDY